MNQIYTNTTTDEFIKRSDVFMNILKGTTKNQSLKLVTQAVQHDCMLIKYVISFGSDLMVHALINARMTHREQKFLFTTLGIIMDTGRRVGEAKDLINKGIAKFNAHILMSYNIGSKSTTINTECNVCFEHNPNNGVYKCKQCTLNICAECTGRYESHNCPMCRVDYFLTEEVADRVLNLI